MRTLYVAASLALSGRYAAMGRQSEAGLRIAADQFNAGPIRIGGEPTRIELSIRDDESSLSRCAGIYREIFASRADIILGPYASDLTRAVAPIAESAGRLLINHGGADDSIHASAPRFVVAVLSPASTYLKSFVKMLAALKFWRKRLAIVSSGSDFASAAANGCESEAASREIRRHGVRVRVKWSARFDPDSSPLTLFPALRRNRVNAVVSAGSFAHDVSVIRAIVENNLNIPVLGCVAAGVSDFRVALGDAAEGIVGLSQWDSSMTGRPELGLDTISFVREMRVRGFESVDYPAAQSYVALTIGLDAARQADSTDSFAMRAALASMRTSTLFGDFAIDPSNGAQVGHKTIAVQWHGGKKIVIEPSPEGDRGGLELPSGWHLMVAGLDILNLWRRGDGDEPKD